VDRLNELLDKIGCSNAEFFERRLEDYRRDPTKLSPSWQALFQQLNGAAQPRSQPAIKRRSVFNPVARTADSATQHVEGERLQDRVDQMMLAFRLRGHLAASLDPLGSSRPEPPELLPESHGLTRTDFDRPCLLDTGGESIETTVGEVIDRLRDTYCRAIGVQFMHIDDPGVRRWLQQRMERSRNRIDLSRDEQLRILSRLTDAVIFEEFVRKKYVGAKTFSLEGSESLIPLLDLAIEKAAQQGIREIVVGMAHRGRLNVLANIIGKRPIEIFHEFNDSRPELHRGRGDVSYHLGSSGNWQTQSGEEVHLSLCFNPSHLEFVNPVALGRMRAKQARWQDTQHNQGMALLIHGDAGFSGEGIVQETLNLGQLDWYTTGGTLHVIVNNQLGFTTPTAQQRSTQYPTDVARMLQIPIFHVNGEHPDAVAQVVELAMDFRHEFHRDAVVDMWCYRRWGHNEADEPSFTQPLMYRAIENRESVRDGYLEHLLELRGISRDEADQIADERQKELRSQFQQAQDEPYEPTSQPPSDVWEPFSGGPEPDDEGPDTAVEASRLSKLLEKLTDTPDDFHRHEKLDRSVVRRRQMASGEAAIDWSAAEALAIASLATEGHPVRLSGQDSQRGTFSQRHAVLHDVEDGSRYEIFQHLADDQAPVEIVNSPLCEAGALGFEYGFSLDHPNALVAWEAQFGDFANAAQVIIDQMIASSEDKWRRLSGLVLLLPHGFEGQGPEHSSARLDRFLALAAEDNLQVAFPTTAAQYFHLLRRQVKRPWRKPLVVLTPKSLLRDARANSSLEDLASGGFRRVLSDQDHRNADRVLLCSGKVYYDLLEYREDSERGDVAIVRLEQLYPLQDETLFDGLAAHEQAKNMVWVQEEPENMGAWRYLFTRFGAELANRPFSCIARPASASPATGSKASHKREQKDLMRKAFDEAD